MACPVCRQRKGRRECPALAQSICSVCCGTKRLTEINCPDSCGYLASAREHPAAVVRRQEQRDVDTLLPSIRHLTERQYQLFFLFHTLISRHHPQGFARLLDEDVAEAAAALAATLETSARGVIYEHPSSTVTAQRLLAEMKTMLEEIREKGGKVYDGETAITLRAIERGARQFQTEQPGGTGYLALMGRLLKLNAQPALR